MEGVVGGQHAQVTVPRHRPAGLLRMRTMVLLDPAFCCRQRTATVWAAQRRCAPRNVGFQERATEYRTCSIFRRLRLELQPVQLQLGRAGHRSPSLFPEDRGIERFFGTLGAAPLCAWPVALQEGYELRVVGLLGRIAKKREGAFIV